MVNLAYYYHYGYHRCNLAQDSELEEGVYAYVDIESALRNIDKSKAKDRTICLGLVAGYLKHTQNKKRSHELGLSLMQTIDNFCTMVYGNFVTI